MLRSTALCLLVAAPLVALAPAASAASTLRATGTVTDNYKASYNEDPTAPEGRTWLQMRGITAGSVTYRPASRPASGHAYVDPTRGLALRGSDGSRATLTAHTTSGNVTGQGLFRVEPQGPFGLLIQERDRAALRDAPIRETFTLRRDGAVVGTLSASYRYDAQVYDAPPSSIEHGGPGGRWWVSGRPTRLDWQPAPAITSPVLPAR